jgi:hypothetical protein
MQRTLQNYHFGSALSFKPLIDFWSRTAIPFNGGKAGLPESLQRKLAEAPELTGPIEDLSILEPHRDLIRQLMSVVFPEAFWETEPLAAVVPFSIQPFLVSPAFQRLLLGGDGSFRGRPKLEQGEYVRARLARCYSLILSQCYGIGELLHFPYIHIVPDPETGLESYFSLEGDLRFVEVHRVGGPDRLSEKERLAICEHLAEPEVLAKMLPPENFEFRGFTVLKAIDVTDSEVLSALERDLVDRESIISRTGFLRLQERLRTLFRRPDLVTSLAAIQSDTILLLNTGCGLDHCCIFADSRHVPKGEFRGTFFEKAAMERKTIRIRDLAEEPSLGRPEEDMLRQGKRSLMVAPLSYQETVIGTLDLSSDEVGAFGSTELMLMNQILPLFSMGLQGALDNFHHNIEAIIKEKCTAIHPSVEWRFRKAVIDHLEGLHSGRLSELAPIVFRDVYPFYGASDIRGSSDARNWSIQADLSEHLTLALEIVRAAGVSKRLPIVRELAYRVARHLDKIEQGVSTGDEVSVLRFVRSEVEPLFPLLRGFGPKVAEAVLAYEGAVDPLLGTIYRRRKEFEESVSLFNSRISAYLDREEAEAQALCPHYFNKHQTDGVEYTIYMGASMVENGAFDELYLRNLRLWQLMTACGIAWHTEQLRAQLKVPLDSTHLVLVNHSPLSIRFRFDEKRFDVDGAYDIAHEIVRSRIDKAVVRGGRERLTQPGKIAVVYSRADEAQEMLGHIDFLQNQGFLTGDLESLELEDLPGVQGLKALRVGINLQSQAVAERAGCVPSPESVSTPVSALS